MAPALNQQGGELILQAPARKEAFLRFLHLYYKYHNVIVKGRQQQFSENYKAVAKPSIERKKLLLEIELVNKRGAVKMLDDFFQSVQVGHAEIYLPGRGRCGLSTEEQHIRHLHLFRGN